MTAGHARRDWTIIKLRPDGSEAARYAATGLPAPPGWVAARAIWRYRRVDIGLMTFQPGDVLDEFFALDRPYNAFAVYRANGAFAGWYCNVTYPTSVTDGTIIWHDLYIDVVCLPDGTLHVLDEDELADAGLASADPALHAMIVSARDELLARIAAGEYPFSEARAGTPATASTAQG